MDGDVRRTAAEDVPLARQNGALTALALILAITAAWWALALWPSDGVPPSWVERTRLACFGAAPGGLPDAGGWLVMIGQPLGMLGVLFAAWWRDLRAGLRRVQCHLAGQLVVGVTLAGVIAGVAGVALRVRDANAQPFYVNSTARLASNLTWVDDSVPATRLVDQSGSVVRLDAYRGKPVLVTFAYAHCATVCPLTVSDVVEAQKQLGDAAPEVFVVTLDPLRDTPSRLPTIATEWNLGPRAHVLSGSVGEVEQVLNAWRIPRVRNAATGDISHPTLVYVIGPDGRIHYATPRGAETIAAAVKSL